MLSEKKIHEHGFVKLIDVQGSDQLIEDAARVSYGQGTRKKSETRGLLRYLMRHRHTSPFEMGGLVFHIKLPIFVMRQLVRHRTASLNEYSGRYSLMSDEFYHPAPEYIQKQSKTNKQGRGGDEYDDVEKRGIQIEYASVISHAHETYRKLIEEKDYSRELARAILPVANYTECFWKINLHNFFHFSTLRTDSHAQKEIQDFANAMVELAQPHFPISFEAWVDYQKESKTFSRIDQQMLRDAVRGIDVSATTPEQYGMSAREYAEMLQLLSGMKIENNNTEVTE